MRVVARSEENASLLENLVAERTMKLAESNRKLEAANKRVTKASAAQLKHFASMSHEIRTPLNCIIGLSSLLEDSDLNSSQNDMIQMIISSGSLLQAVVDDVLDYSKLVSGAVEINWQKVNLQDTLNAVVRSIEPKAASSGLSLRTFYDARLMEYITTDSQRLQQVLFNLLSNAIKFSVGDSFVDLTVSIDKARWGSIPLAGSTPNRSSGQERIKFTVADYGVGIAKQNLAKIFEPFMQESPETEKVYGGTGLGLAITAKLVKALGGRISVDSVEGEWTKFTVDFPIKEEPADINNLAMKLSDTTACLVCGNENTQTRIKGYFDEFHAELQRFSSLKELREAVASGRVCKSRRLVLIIDECLYETGSFAALSRGFQHAALVSFGPTYSVDESHKHYYSLEQRFPSLLIQDLGQLSNTVASQKVPTPPVQLDTADTSVSSSTRSLDTLKILVAEDNVVNQKVLNRILTRLGIQNVVTVENGKLAVERESQQDFDIVLMDIQMPIMDGIEACRLIRARSESHAKVVFVTAHVTPSFEAECNNAGGVAFLPKPCNIQSVGACLKQVSALEEP